MYLKIGCSNGPPAVHDASTDLREDCVRQGYIHAQASFAPAVSSASGPFQPPILAAQNEHSMCQRGATSRMKPGRAIVASYATLARCLREATRAHAVQPTRRRSLEDDRTSRSKPKRGGVHCVPSGSSGPPSSLQPRCSRGYAALRIASATTRRLAWSSASPIAVTTDSKSAPAGRSASTTPSRMTSRSSTSM